MIDPILDMAVLRELNNTVKDLNQTIKGEIKTNERITAALFTLAFLQLVIALVQLGIDVIPAQQEFLRVGLVFFALAACVYLFRLMSNTDK